MTQASLDLLCDLLGHRFQNHDLLSQALTHASQRQSSSGPHYERLEFLGDRVLGLVIAELLFKKFPDDSEGSLAKRLAYLVSKEALLDVAKEIHLESYIRVSKSVSASGERRKASVLADICEAILGALYLDGGLSKARQFIHTYWQPLLDGLEKIPQDAKSRLQEWAQGRGDALPTYRLQEEKGPNHAPTFTVKVEGKGFKPETGSAPSKRQAQQKAAQKVLHQLGITD